MSKEVKSTGPKLAVGLLHYPVLDRLKNEVATNILNLDIHDIARACRTFGVDRYYIIHKSEEQQMFVSRVLEHWRLGRGLKFNPKRAESLSATTPVGSLERALAHWDRPCKVVATSARSVPGVDRIEFSDLKAQMESESVFLLFGTGHGLSEETMMQCDNILAPISSCAEDGFNHLSVRSAVSICLDRLMSS